MEINSNRHETTLDGQVFTGEIDRFKGVTVTSKDEAQLNREELSEKLKKSIKKWKHEVIASINNIILFQINFFMVHLILNIDITFYICFAFELLFFKGPSNYLV